MHALTQQLHEAVEDGLQKTNEKQAVEHQLQREQQVHLQLEARYSASQQQLTDLKANNSIAPTGAPSASQFGALPASHAVTSI